MKSLSNRIEMPSIDFVMRSLPERFRPKMAGNFQAIVQFEFTGTDEGMWILDIGGGQCEVSKGEAANPDAIVTMSTADFVGINTGDIAAPEVFWSGRIQIEGDVDAVIGLAPIMSW